jgi:hypothetical protein
MAIVSSGLTECDIPLAEYHVLRQKSSGKNIQYIIGLGSVSGGRWFCAGWAGGGRREGGEAPIAISKYFSGALVFANHHPT